MTVVKISATAGPFEPAVLREDAGSWDRFVESSPINAYTQLSAWADVKRANGWSAERILTDSGSGPIGGQVLLRRFRPTPFGVGYVPRGPVAQRLDRASLTAFTDELRELMHGSRLSHVTIDPEVDDPEAARLLRALGWVRGRDVQPLETRLIDIDRPEPEIWGGLRSKWRQYVQKARRAGIEVIDSDAAGLDDFYRIMVETGERTGFAHRTLETYRRSLEAYAARGAGRLLMARLSDGTPLATLMLIGCGRRVVEHAGGMTEAGAASRANYLLKWEAIRSSSEAGFAVYDLWGLARWRPGIEHFKAGFGGREVRYIGAWDLVGSAPMRAALMGAYRLRFFMAQRRMSRDAETGSEADRSP